MFSSRRTRRRNRVTSLPASAELCEERIVLTQLVPVPDVVSTDFVVHTSLESTLLGGFDSVAGEQQAVIRSLDHESGSLSAPQILPGASSIKASADGRLLITGVATSALTDSGDTSFNVEFVFYRRSITGLYEETARYVFPTELNSGPVLAPVFHDEGAFLMAFARPLGRKLYFLSSTQAAEPELVASTETASWGFHAEAQGDDLFLESSESRPRRLFPDGTVGSTVPLFSPPLAILGNRTQIFRQNNQLFSWNETAGVLELLESVPKQSLTSLISAHGGPEGKAVLFSAALDSLSVIVSDGTAAGTQKYTSPARSYQGFSDGSSHAVLLPVSSTVIINRGLSELWSLNLSSGVWSHLPDTNEFGGDRIFDLVVRGSQAWFHAQETDGDIGIYRTDGISTTNEFDVVEMFKRIWIIGDGTSFWTLETSAGMPLRSRSGTKLYRINSEAPELPTGPAGVSTEVLTDGNGKRLQVEWTPVPGAISYEVVVVPWWESGSVSSSANPVAYSRETPNTHLSINLTQGYGWHTARIRAVGASGDPTDWSSTAFALTEEMLPPDRGQYFFHQDELRFGYAFPQTSGDWGMVKVLVHRADNQSLIHTETSYSRYETHTIGSPYSGSNSYRYHPLPSLPDGNYIVTFLRQYRDPNPQPVDLTLPAQQVVTWLTLRNGQIVQTPPILNVTVDPDTVQFSWTEPLAPDHQEYQLWVSDLSRGTPRIINESLRGDSVEHPLSNGHYRAFIGRKDSITGQTIWSAPVEFTVSTQVPELINPQARSVVRRPVFRWTGRERSRYEVWLGDLGTGTRVALNRGSGSTQWSPSMDLPAGRYALWVRELVTDAVASNWSVRHVFIQEEAAVVVTGGLDPGLNQTPKITWESRADALTYELWISRTGVPGAVYSEKNLRGTSHRLARPIGNGAFTVWVRATLKDGRTTAWGAGYALVIDAGVQVQSSGSTLTWNTVSTANRYELWVNYEGGDAAKQAKILHLPSLRSTSFDLPSTLPQGRYRVWVRALRIVGKRTSISSWSAPVEFTIS